MFKQNCLALVVEDMEAMRKITAQQLRQYGAKEVYQASNGAEALRILRNHRIELILSDWNMPVMTGIDFLKAVKADENWQRIPFIMVTAEAERDKVREAIRFGVSELIIKPFTPNMMRERIERAFKRPVRIPSEIKISEPAEAPVAVKPDLDITSLDDPGNAEDAAKLKDGNILIVDDTPDNLRLMSDLLKDDYRVRLANNGKKALELCQGDTPPDLVLLDIMMPEISGYDVLEQLRENPATSHIPVIMVTAMTEQEAEVKGIQMGAIEFITKPIQPELLQLRVRNFMRQVWRIRDIQASYDDMIEAAQAKEAAEQIVRHDIKGPIAGILAAAEQISANARRPELVADLAGDVDSMARQLLNLIELTQIVYKIESNQYDLKAVPVNTVDLLQDVTASCKRIFDAKRITCNVFWPKAQGAELLVCKGEEVLLFSVFNNLIKNAFEAARPKSAVRVHIEKTNANQIEILISNDGVVPETIREHFFEKYVSEGKAGGSGIGTYSAKLLTEAMAGEIDMHVDDEANLTTMTVTLPCP
ncbi:hybrid sensor histidine kinase/response regulator [Neiella marina]|uniref:histidine kinase n=1 Tax=Neiella holothuriorum TaxID=2870530 RepID=A0ABS7ELM0_9GAMM|nr:hybrid sensor histidine kinase/response regulator [Neiella holothuriorum]MBW8192758.1 hybrid sensor histidine kinase/response regulator [Neiella holothuriorum]